MNLELEFNSNTMGEVLFAYADIPEELRGGAFINQLDYDGAIDEIKYLADRVEESDTNNLSSSEPPIKTYKIYVENTAVFKKELGDFLLGLLESAIEGYSEGNELCPICKRINNRGECDTCEHYLGLTADGGFCDLPDEILEPLEDLISLVADDNGEAMEQFVETHQKFKALVSIVVETQDPVAIMTECTEVSYGDDIQTDTLLSAGGACNLYSDADDGFEKLLTDVKELIKLFEESRP